MDQRKIVIGGIAALLVAAAAWILGFFGRTDPAVAELEQMRAQMSDDNLPDAQRDAVRDQFRDRIRALSDEQRRMFFATNRGQWRGRMEQRMGEFFAMSTADQRQRLDEMIDRMHQRRQQRSQTQNANGNRGGGDNGRRRGDWANMTEAQRDERAKRRLDRTSATQRAQFTEFRRRLVERAKERGIHDLSSLGGRPGGWRGA
jgi:uncharacterized membrane protein